jgi:hypothetical protein
LDKTSAVCDRCNTDIPKDQGFLCKSSIIMAEIGDIKLNGSDIPELICEECFDKDVNSEPYDKHLPYVCDKCGKLYTEAKSFHVITGREGYISVYNPLNMQKVQVGRYYNIKPFEVYICKKCLLFITTPTSCDLIILMIIALASFLFYLFGNHTIYLLILSIIFVGLSIMFYISSGKNRRFLKKQKTFDEIVKFVIEEEADKLRTCTEGICKKVIGLYCDGNTNNRVWTQEYFENNIKHYVDESIAKMPFQL